jgi:hypothetical protein
MLSLPRATPDDTVQIPDTLLLNIESCRYRCRLSLCFATTAKVVKMADLICSGMRDTPIAFSHFLPVVLLHRSSILY